MKITVLNFSQVKTRQKAETIAEVVSKFKSNFIVTFNGSPAVNEAFKSEIQRRQPQYFNTHKYVGDGTEILYLTNKRTSQLAIIEHKNYKLEDLSNTNGVSFQMNNSWYALYLAASKQSPDVTSSKVRAMLSDYSNKVEDVALAFMYIDEGILEFDLSDRCYTISKDAAWPVIVSKEHRTILSPVSKEEVLLNENECLVIRMDTCNSRKGRI